jgi:hypothetical protein
VNETFDVAVYLKLFAVVKLIVLLPPEPKFENNSLKLGV